MSLTTYKIRLDAKQFESKLSRLDAKVSAFERKVKQVSLGGGGRPGTGTRGAGGAGLLGGFGIGSIAITAAAAGIGLVTKRIIKLGAEGEKSRLTLSKLLGGKQKGELAFAATERFAKFTPFSFQQVLKSRIGLGARGVSAENQLPLLEILGNFASVLGTETLPFLSKAVGDVLSKGRLQGQEIRQFSESGVNIRKLVADFKGIAVSDVERTFISARDVIEALQAGQGKGTRFFDSMADAAKTVGGRFETTKDTIEEILRSVGEDLLPTISRGLSAFNSVIGDLQGKNFSNLLTSVGGVFTQISDVTKGTALKTEGSPLLRFIDSLTVGFTALRIVGAEVNAMFAKASILTQNLPFSVKKVLIKGIDRNVQGVRGESDERIRRILANFGVARDARGNPIKVESAPDAGVGGLNIGAFSSSVIGGGATAAGGGGGGASGIRGGGRKEITINIENVIRDLDISTTAGQTGEEIKEQVQRALQVVFTEARIAQ